MTIKELHQYFIGEISPFYNEEEAREMFYLVVQHFSGWTRSYVILNSQHNVCEEQESLYMKVVTELKQDRPLQHILGEAWFFGLKFKITSAVLIPRPETEELVDWIIDTANRRTSPVRHLLDVGTGSGCIAVSLKLNLPSAMVSGLEVSPDALKIARENALDNNADITFIAADILTFSTAEQYDIIVSNPPYITPAERQAMHANVLHFEPHLALFVTEHNPLVFYSAIAELASTQLNPGGQLFFEINEYYGKEMVDMLTSKMFTNIELRKDMQGKDRMICATAP